MAQLKLNAFSASATVNCRSRAQAYESGANPRPASRSERDGKTGKRRACASHGNSLLRHKMAKNSPEKFSGKIPLPRSRNNAETERFPHARDEKRVDYPRGRTRADKRQDHFPTHLLAQSKYHKRTKLEEKKKAMSDRVESRYRSQRSTCDLERDRIHPPHFEGSRSPARDHVVKREIAPGRGKRRGKRRRFTEKEPADRGETRRRRRRRRGKRQLG
ncbi:hypothetical protein ALC62_05608 [Cyphomyrmex costatus]|uniref:Uncharacterized protein n=1 Tax=Cyphomyrmex costatus TaxID=456900 RepID=A0A195CS05_9HYME|nr:hypothetical protein ALC62_05608 [Cyphomyrmex costatus]